MRLFDFLVPLWLLGIVFPPTLESDFADVLHFGSLVWLPCVALLMGRDQFLIGPVLRKRMSMLFWTAATLVTITGSALVSADPLRSLGYVAASGVGLICCAGLWQIVKTHLFDWLSTYAMLGSALVVYLYFTGPRIQGRLSMSATSHANYLGLVAFGFLMCALVVRSRFLAALLIVTNFVVIIAAQSRGPLIAAVLGLLVYGTLKLTCVTKGNTAFAAVSACLVCVVVLLIYQDAVENWVSSLLFLHDKYRGIGTGFTRRLDAWQEALDLFKANPMFGVGFRMHEQYMTTLSSAHNGYLSLLADVGLVGAISPFVLTALSAWRLLRLSLDGNEIAILGFSFVVGYLFLATFERFLLGMGNPTSIVAWLFLFMPDGSRTVTSPGIRSCIHWKTMDVPV